MLDSFITVKFDDDGHASWDSEGADNTEEIDESRGMEEQIEHDNALKWKKRIGQLLRVARWRTPDADLQGGAKGRRVWMRSLTRRRSTNAH